MPRPQKCRRVCAMPRWEGFVPVGKGRCRKGDAVEMSVDEYEVIRLVDLEDLTQEECAARMEIARTTVTGIYDAARRKLAEALVNGRPLVIGGGNYRLCDGRNPCGAGGCRRWAESCCGKKHHEYGGESAMRIAVTYENGSIFQHFGHTAQFKVYDVEDGKVKSTALLNSGETGHGALATLLKDGGVDALICGGIGGGAQMALAQAGITLYGGVTGDADAAVEALLNGTLAYSAAATCDHHDHEHGHDCHGHGHEHGGCHHGHECGHN